MSRERDYLFELEWSAYRISLPNSRRGAATWGGAMAALLLASVIFLRESVTVEASFGLGVVLVAFVSFFHAFLTSMTVWEHSFKDWWLTMPHDRSRLIRAKALAVMRMQACVALAIWIVCVLNTVIRDASGVFWASPLTAGRIVADALAYGLLTVAVVPLSVSIGLTLMGMYYGWTRWLLIPYAIAFFSPSAGFPILAASTEAMRRWQSADAVAVCALLVLVLAVPVYRLAIGFAAKRGLPAIARHRAGGAGTLPSSAAAKRQSEERFRGRRTGFAAVYALERSRYRHFGSHKLFRIPYRLLAGLIVVGGFFAMNNRESLIGAFQALIMIFTFLPGIVLVTLSQIDANKRRIAWWLSFPYGRGALVAARLLGALVSVGRWGFGVVGAYALGGAVRIAAYGVPDFVDRTAFVLLAYILVFYLLIGTLIACFMSGQAASYTNSLAAWLYLPVMMLAFFVPMAINSWVLPDSVVAAGIGARQWLSLAGVLVLGVPLAALCLRAGARYMHLYLFHTTEMAQRRRGEGFSRKI